MDDVADIEQADAGDAVERRDQRGIAQLRLGIVDGRLVSLDRVLQLRHRRLLAGQLLLRGKSLAGQRFIPIEIGLRIGEMGLVAAQRRLCLIELRLIGARIDLGEQIAGLDRLAFLEVDAYQQPRDLAADRRRVQRRHRAEAGQDDRHVVTLDGGCDDGNRRERRRRRRRRLIPIRPGEEEDPAGQKRRHGGGDCHFRPSLHRLVTPNAGVGTAARDPLGRQGCRLIEAIWTDILRCERSNQPVFGKTTPGSVVEKDGIRSCPPGRDQSPAPTASRPPAAPRMSKPPDCRRHSRA